MKVYLIKADVNTGSCLQSATRIDDGLIGDEHRASLQGSIADSDLFITDTSNIQVGSFLDVLYKNKHHIFNRVNNGGVVLCFAGPLYGGGDVGQMNNYGWIPAFQGGWAIQNLEAKDIEFDNKKQFGNFLNSIVSVFKSLCFFSTTRPEGLNPIAHNKSGGAVALYGPVGKGHVFIVPKPSNKEEFSELFCQKILPNLGVSFEIFSGNTEPVPEDITNLLVAGSVALKESIKKQEEVLAAAANKLKQLNEDYRKIDSWKELLFETGTVLEDRVKSFFSALGLNLQKEEVDLVGEYKGKKVFIEVKGNKGCVNHKDFRQTHERKFSTDDPGNTIALLVGNAFRLYPLTERPPKSQPTEFYLFAPTFLKSAEHSGIGLISTLELYKIINDLLDSSKTINRKPLLDDLLSSVGVYKYKPDAFIKNK